MLLALKIVFQSFTQRYWLSVSLKCVSCKQQNVGSCLHIQSVSLCLFVGKLSLSILIHNEEKLFLLPVFVVFVVVLWLWLLLLEVELCSYGYFWGFVKGRLLCCFHMEKFPSLFSIFKFLLFVWLDWWKYIV